MDKYKNKGFVPILLLFIVAAAVLAAAGGAWWWNKEIAFKPSLNALPEHGKVPLEVQFKAYLSGSPYCSSVKIDFGDGEGQLIQPNCIDNNFLIGLSKSLSIFFPSLVSKHTYQSVGVFNASVSAGELRASTTVTVDSSLGVTDISAWQTYRNEKYGFEFWYPADWTYFSEENDIISIGTGKDTPNNFEAEKIRIEVAANKDNKSLDQIISDEESSLYKTHFNDFQKVVLGGADARSFTESREGGFTAQNIYTIHNGYLYKVWYGNSNGDINPSIPQVQALLETFKFTFTK